MDDLYSFCKVNVEIKNVSKCFNPGESILTVLDALVTILSPATKPENIECFRIVARLLLPTKANPQGAALKMKGGAGSTATRLEVLRPPPLSELGDGPVCLP